MTNEEIFRLIFEKKEIRKKISVEKKILQKIKFF